MKSWTYNKEVQTLIEQFAGAFNDIIIKRFDNNSIPLPNTIKTNFVYSPKQRVLEALRTPAPGGLTVPAIAINISSISRDNTRVFNKNTGFNIQTKSLSGSNIDFLKYIRQPVPINIGINMSIITKFQTDMDQILSNFIPYCDPYIIISWKLPVGYNKEYEIRSEILWSGTINVNYPVELPASQTFKVIADTSFTIKGWLFKSDNVDTLKKIYYINTDFVPVLEDDINSCKLITDLDQYETETTHISARPHIYCNYPHNIIKDNIEMYYENNLMYITGKFFSYTRAMYISTTPNVFEQPEELFNPFQGLSSLEPLYPSFHGYKLSAYQIIDDETITLSLPFSSANIGCIDIIVENEAGYRSLISETEYRHNIYKQNLIPTSLYKPAALSGILIT